MVFQHVQHHADRMTDAYPLLYSQDHLVLLQCSIDLLHVLIAEHLLGSEGGLKQVVGDFMLRVLVHEVVPIRHHDFMPVRTRGLPVLQPHLLVQERGEGIDQPIRRSHHPRLLSGERPVLDHRFQLFREALRFRLCRLKFRH